MPTRFRIKRRLLGGAGAGSPTGLLNAELAFNENDRLLYIGIGDDGTGLSTNVIPITGPGATLPDYTSNALKLLRLNSTATAIEWVAPSSPGVNSVSVTVPSGFSVSGNPITGTSGNSTGVGTIAISLQSQNKNLVFSSPTSATGTPSFRALEVSDIPVSSIPLNSLAAPTANIDLGGTYTLTNIPNPTSPLHVVNKQYVDGLSQGLTVHTPVVVATLSNINLFNVQTIDGIVVALEDRVLVKSQSSSISNGIYVVKATNWVRATDADNAGELQSGSFVFVTSGQINGNSSFVLTSTGSIIPGVSNQEWVIFSTAGLLNAGQGLVKNGNILDVIGGAGIAVNADNIELTGQALAFHNLASNGLVTRTAANTLTSVTITGTTDQITVTNGSGVSGNPVISLASTYKGQASITTVGTITAGEWKSTTAPVGVPYGGTGSTFLGNLGVLIGNGSSPVTAVPKSNVDGSVLIQNATGVPFFSNVFDGGIF